MKLFIANISRECTEHELTEAFSACGKVKSLKIITDRDTGQSRGFGFVEMENREASEKAIQELHQKRFYGRAIVVMKSKEQERRPPRGEGGPRKC